VASVVPLQRETAWPGGAENRAGRHKVRFLGPSEGRTIVFSHGLGTDQTSWRAVVKHLPPGCRAMLFDLPGAGPLLPLDFDPDAYTSLAPFADDLLRLLDETGVERCVYVGHSVSGMIGALASIEAPERFERLILLNASPRYLNDNDNDYIGGFGAADLDGLFGAMSANYQNWVAGFAPLAVGADVPAAVREFSDGLLAMRPDITARIARAIFESDVRHLLHLVQVPTALVHARGDIAVPEAVAHYLHAHIVGSSLEWIEAEGHLPHLSAPQEIVRVLHAQLG
jgi:pimeloyl-ACP methyl ester carboxylesterase